MNEPVWDEPYSLHTHYDFLQAMNRLTEHHLQNCPEYAQIWPHWTPTNKMEDLPYLHVGVFKHVNFKTKAADILHQRTLKSSATSGGTSSLIALDQKSSKLQSASTLAILKDFLGTKSRPLLILDSSRSLRSRGEMSARIAAAMSLRPLACEMHFLLQDSNDQNSMKWDALAKLLERFDDLLVYGFTWILWLAWGAQTLPEEIRNLLKNKRISFIHSGGWKKLEEIKVDRATFDAALLDTLHPDAKVIDFYGLVEQVGIIYPLCSAGFRHVPVWADVIVRDTYTLEPVIEQIGQLQLLNSLAYGAPYHSVYTEDLGRIVADPCPCGRCGNRFELIGRVPKAEVRGCANVL